MYGAGVLQAAADDDVDMVEALLMSGMCPNVYDASHRTPLHLAVANKSFKVCTLTIFSPNLPGVHMWEVHEMSFVGPAFISARFWRYVPIQSAHPGAQASAGSPEDGTGTSRFQRADSSVGCDGGSGLAHSLNPALSGRSSTT